jgi:hypothetical protein
VKATKTYVDEGVTTLTNKTITATSNTIAAKQLLSGTTAIDVYASAAPTIGQVLTATSGSAATWQASKGQAAGTTAGDMQYWNGTAWVVIPATTNEGATLQMISDVPTWVGGASRATVGDFRDGGIVFWVDPADNTHGLVCAIEDQGY